MVLVTVYLSDFNLPYSLCEATTNTSSNHQTLFTTISTFNTGHPWTRTMVIIVSSLRLVSS